jgi:hypothetical protein
LTEHRHPPDGQCYTSVSLEVVLRDHTGQLSRENIMDDTCQVEGPIGSLGNPG